MMDYIPYRLFETIDQMLKSAWVEIPGDLGAKFGAVKKALNDNRAGYGNSLGSGGPVFSNPAKRFAYIVRHVAPHARWTYSVLDRYRSAIIPILNKPTSTVWSICGGPGTDLLSLLTCYEKWNCSGQVRCLNFDREPGWSRFVPVLNGTARRRQLSFAVDLISSMDADGKVALRERGNPDLILTVYALSDAHHKRETAGSSLKHILSQSNPNSIAVFLDIAGNPCVQRSVQWSDGIFRAAGYKQKDGRDFEKLSIEPWEWRRCVGLYGHLFDLSPAEGNACHRLWQREPKPQFPPQMPRSSKS